eukprot:TRINITY_DN100861_c0_g1_i1.p1 TRINITY_DN100861_c0_g1~~TRINITY_DN100861_c0_g1_i1.p1  ORF type:complete len:365 (+),score=52.65 TRINITY_DN100861_c0_g1_i1:92-1186(+)
MATRLDIAPLFAVTTVTVALNSIYFKRMLNAYRTDRGPGETAQDYVAFVSVFDVLLWAVLLSTVQSVGGWQLSPGARLPKRCILRAAAVDQLGSLLAILGAATVPGQTQVLISQGVLPVTMAISIAAGRSYGRLESSGALVVLLGACIALHDGWPAGSFSTVALRSDGLGFLAAFLLLSQQVAFAGGCLLKESLLKRQLEEYVGDCVALGATIAWLRVPFGVLLALLASPVRSAGILDEFKDGWFCFCGYAPRPGNTACAGAARATLLSIVLYVAQTLLCLRLIQSSNATILSIAAVTALPVSQLLFSSEFLATESGAEGYSHGAAIGLLCCLCGFALHLRGHLRSDSCPPSCSSPLVSLPKCL